MKNISDYDDNLVACMVSECRRVMEGHPTVSKMTACFNLTIGVLRLFCVRGDKEDVIALANKFHEEMIKEINHLYE